MIKKLRKLWVILEASQKRSILIIQVSVLFLAFFELFTIGVMAAFMQLVTDEDKLSNLIDHFGFLSLTNNGDVLLLISFLLIIILSISSFSSVVVFKRSTLLSMNIGHQIACKLLDYYLSKDWLYHTRNNSSKMANNVIVEATRLSSNIILPFINLVSRCVLIAIISVSILLYDPIFTLFILFFFVFCYFLASKIVRKKLLRNSKIIHESNQEKIKSVNESMDSVKMVILDDKKEGFLKRFYESNGTLSRSHASNITLSLSPRYMMEWLAFVSMVLIIIFNIISGRNLSEIIPVLTVYGLAAFKILPSLQQVYASISTIKGNISALEIITSELEQFEKIKIDEKKSESIEFNNFIELSDVNFCYPGKSSNAINGLTLQVKKNQTVGIVGESGAGKSTLIDILCGLIDINSGRFDIDGNDVKHSIKEWRRHVSYVPQSISLSDSTIAENIAFGVHPSKIDKEWLSQVINLACLSDLIDSLDSGINTVIGEKGVQLSGGQRQRIGIARALYKNSNVIILDEATSALDGITENKIMQAINMLSGKKTIVIIAHRIKTIKNCDIIYMLKDGMVVDSNNYEGLLLSNSKFKEMEKYA